MNVKLLTYHPLSFVLVLTASLSGWIKAYSQRTAKKWIKTKNTCEGRTEFLAFANWIKICRFVKSSLSSLRKLFHDSRELKQPRRRQQQKPHKFAYLSMKNSIFARFARAFFIFWHFETSSFFLRREMTCFAVVWTTWAYDDKCSILSFYIWSAGSNLIPG